LEKKKRGKRKFEDGVSYLGWGDLGMSVKKKKKEKKKKKGRGVVGRPQRVTGTKKKRTTTNRPKT